MDLGALSDISTGAVAVLTAIYVAFTGRLNHHTKTTAIAAGASATASQAATEAALATAQSSLRAAEAAERSAASSEAAIPVDFSVSSIVNVGSRTVLNFRSDSVNAYIFSIHVRLLVVPASDGSIREVSSHTTMTNDQGQPVTYVHKGDEAFAVLPEALPVGDSVFGNAVVFYGFSRDPAGREKPVNIPSQQVRHVVDHSD